MLGAPVLAVPGWVTPLPSPAPQAGRLCQCSVGVEGLKLGKEARVGLANGPGPSHHPLGLLQAGAAGGHQVGDQEEGGAGDAVHAGQVVERGADQCTRTRPPPSLEPWMKSFTSLMYLDR